jgi:hypothetical protein
MAYQDLFGMEGPVDSGVTDVAEHGRVGNVSTGQPFKFVSNIDGSLPTAGNNASLTITKTLAPPLVTTVISKVIGATTFTKTIVKNTTTLVETVSAWS